MDLDARDVEVRYIITKQALQEGWDCSFAYVLTILTNPSSKNVESISIVSRETPQTRPLLNPESPNYPALREFLIPPVDPLLCDRRKGIEHMPDRTSREPDHRFDPKPGGHPAGFGHFLRRALPHAFRIAIAPNVRWQNALMTLIDRIANTLAYQMARNGE